MDKEKKQYLIAWLPLLITMIASVIHMSFFNNATITMPNSIWFIACGITVFWGSYYIGKDLK